MSGYHRIACHVNLHRSSTTYSYFCLKHLAKKALKKANYPETPPKTNKKPPLETSKPENMQKWRTQGVKNKNFKKNKRALGSGRYYSQNQE